MGSSASKQSAQIEPLLGSTQSKLVKKKPSDKKYELGKPEVISNPTDKKYMGVFIGCLLIRFVGYISPCYTFYAAHY